MTSPPSPPLELRLSVTDRCQLRCRYCAPLSRASDPAARRRGEILAYEELARFVRLLGARFRLSKVRLTGGEPLLRRDVATLVRLLAAEGIPDLALTTNGQLLPELAAELARAGLRRVNVSLDSLDERTYAALTGGGRLARVLAGLEAARRAGLSPVKLNTVVLRGVNDREVVALARFALAEDFTLRFLELMPIGPARERHAELFVPAAEVRARLAEAFRLAPLARAPGASSGEYLADDGRGRHGRVGLIAPVTEPFCAGCRRLRLSSTGELAGCLARAAGPNVRALLADESPRAAERLAALAAGELARKRTRAETGAAGCFAASRPMVAVGG